MLTARVAGRYARDYRGVVAEQGITGLVLLDAALAWPLVRVLGWPRYFHPLVLALLYVLSTRYRTADSDEITELRN